jgi:hypothetical protein
MNRNVILRAKSLSLVVGLAAAATAAHAQPFAFSTGNPDGRIATASRPESKGAIEVESADDFILADRTIIFNASLTGLIPAGAKLSSVKQVAVEIYRVFPLDSNTTRAVRVPTRTNSPSDVAFESRDSKKGSLHYSTVVVSDTFAAANSVINGINPSPNQTTLGEGPVSGHEVTINITFDRPLDLLAGHYFLVPQVQLSDGQFLWLSAPRPIVAPGTPFTPDLQAWIRNENLDPDWLRVGTDIIGGSTPPTFNLAFALRGVGVCYANCDASTHAPALNVNDFVCFQYRYAAGDHYANCDNSTAAPVLNVNDFICYLNRFAAGCTNP